jgi:putative multiple sugar transport system permease protein
LYPGIPETGGANPPSFQSARRNQMLKFPGNLFGSIRIKPLNRSNLIALFTFLTTRTTIGRRIYTLGGNEKAAKLFGVKTERLTFYTFITMGVLAALGGLIFVARLNSATPKAGVGFELDVIAAVFIGGASASGGVGKVLGAVVGAFIMGVMNNGTSILGIGIDWQQVIKGLVLLAAVIFDVYNKNKL